MTQQSDSGRQNPDHFSSSSPLVANGAKDAFDALMVSLKSFIAEGEEKAVPAHARRKVFGTGSGVISFLNLVSWKPKEDVANLSVTFDGDFDPVLPPELIKSYQVRSNRRARRAGE